MKRSTVSQGLTTSRRAFLGGGAAALALMAAPRLHAQAARGTGRFVFVFAEGGWDPLCVFAPKFDAPLIEMEPDAAPYSIGGLALVDHPERAPVRTFFEEHVAKTLMIHGVSTRSVAHDICTLVALTGSSSGSEPDFATWIARESGERALPSLVLSGPSFPGDLESVVSRAGQGGQLGRLADGSFLTDADVGVRALDGRAQRRVDELVVGRARALVGGSDAGRARLLREIDETVQRAARLKEVEADIDLASGDLSTQVDATVRALALDLSRCVSIGTGFVFDTHENNAEQSVLLSDLFTQLDRLVRALEQTPAPEGGTLADDTHVVVLSEMGRTPRLNDDAGRDHWPFTTALVVGPRVTGGRAIGGYDDGYVGIGVDAASGELAPGATSISAANLGATLLALADIDPAEALPTAAPILGVLT